MKKLFFKQDYDREEFLNSIRENFADYNMQNRRGVLMVKDKAIASYLNFKGDRIVIRTTYNQTNVLTLLLMTAFVLVLAFLPIYFLKTSLLINYVIIAVGTGLALILFNLIFSKKMKELEGKIVDFIKNNFEVEE